MKSQRLPLLLVLAFSLSACQTALPTVGNSAANGSVNGNITPSPNGPRPNNPLDVYARAPLAPPVTEAGKATGQINSGAGGSNQAVSAPAGDATFVPEPAPQPDPLPEPTASPTVDPSPNPDPQSAYFYFSYDDSASTAGVEQTKYALRQNQLPQPGWVRPWEFLSFEHFNHQLQQPIGAGTFKVSLGLWQHAIPGQNATGYDLGVHVSGPEISLSQRRNLNLTLVLDVSGSMDEASEASIDANSARQSKLEVAKAGLRNLPSQLKAGDVINLVSFSDDAKVRLKAWTYQGDATTWRQLIDGLTTESSTDLAAGLAKGYELARSTYDKSRINRVVMMTDAFANRGQTAVDVIEKATRINDAEGIYFSGLGFGFGFNEAFLNELTEAGKGTYFSVISHTDAERAFGERFMSLVNIAAENVRFRLDYPPALKRIATASEQSSSQAADVQPIHFSYNTSQYFLESFKTDGEAGAPSGQFKLTIDYRDPLTQELRSETYEQSLEQIRNQDLDNLKDARLITLLTSLIRGQTKPADGQRDLDQLLGSHTSALASEYKAYIQTWLKLNAQNGVQPEVIQPQN